MSIRLLGRLSSANVQKVVWTLEELELPYDHVNLGGRFGGLDSPNYLALNPNGLVPTLQDGPLTLWESHAIVRYLCGQYADGVLFPSLPGERAIVDQWTDWTATRFQPAWIGLFWAAYRTRPERQDPAAITRALANTNAAFAILEGRLRLSPYLGGETLTYADIVAGVAMFRWSTMEIERPELPAVAAWHGRLRDRPAFRRAIEVPYDELKWTI